MTLLEFKSWLQGYTENLTELTYEKWERVLQQLTLCKPQDKLQQPYDDYT